MIKTQTVSEGLELILAGEVSAKDIHARVQTGDGRGPTSDLIRVERALRWLADRQDSEIRKTERIIDYYPVPVNDIYYPSSNPTTVQLNSVPSLPTAPVTKKPVKAIK
jgi:hypothetical protein